MDERGVRVDGLTEHDRRLAMRVAVSQKLRRRADGEVSRHLAPDIVELVGSGPDVRACARDPILASRGTELRRTLEWRRAHVIGTGEEAERSALRQHGHRKTSQ